MNNPQGSSYKARRAMTRGGVFSSLDHLDYEVFINSSLKSSLGCQAVKCPIELYAAWLAKWLEQGGQAYPQEGNFADLSNWVTPTRSTSLMVPEVWGSAALNFVVLSEFASVPGDPNAGNGDGQVLRLTYDRLHRLYATTTEPHKVHSYPDVEQFMFTYDQGTLVSRARKSLRDARHAIKALPRR